MVDQTQAQSDVIAEGVAAEDYMAHYAEHYHEWVEGTVIKMAPVTGTHDTIEDYLRDVLKAYMAFKPIGTLRGAPFVMRLDAVPSRREPDIQVILGENQQNLTDTYMHGAADICIEVVSAESVSRDYGDKLVEYESGGVREYWIIDPIRRRATFNRLSADGKYDAVLPDDDQNYTTPLLTGLKLNVPTLWQETLPNMLEIVALVGAMLNDD